MSKARIIKSSRLHAAGRWDAGFHVAVEDEMRSRHIDDEDEEEMRQVMDDVARAEREADPRKRLARPFKRRRPEDV